MQADGTRQLAGKPQSTLETLFAVYSGPVTLLALLVVIPFTRWVIWCDPRALTYKLAASFFCLSLGWAMFLTVEMFRSWQKAGLTPMQRLEGLSGRGPNDPDELLVWKWSWRWMLRVIATIMSMAAIPLADKPLTQEDGAWFFFKRRAPANKRADEKARIAA